MGPEDDAPGLEPEHLPPTPPPAPDPVPIAPPPPAPPVTVPPTAWQVAPPAKGTSRGVRIFLGAASAALIVLTAVVGALAEGGSGGYAAGYMIGGILTLLLIGLVVRFVVVKLRRRGERVLSPWILVVGAAWGLLLLPVSLGRFAAAAPVDPATRAVIASPYRLEAATPAMQDQLERDMGGRFAVQQIHGPGGYLGVLLIIPDDPTFRWEDFEAGFAGSGRATQTQVDSYEGRLLETGQGYGLAWRSDGVVTMVLGTADEASARTLAAAVNRARAAPGASGQGATPSARFGESQRAASAMGRPARRA